MIQWHPLFVHLIRPVLQDYFDIQTDVPVGELPRRADIVLLHRTTPSRPRFQSLWRHLTPWNVLEFKGRTESARIEHVDSLVEVGMGIHRRLQEGPDAEKIPRTEFSLWYLTNHMGKRFLRDAARLLGGLESAGQGLWRWHILNRPVWLISNRDVPVDRESIPVHLVSEESITTERAVAEMVVSQPDWWTIYGPWLATLHPRLWKEVVTMARRRGAEAGIDFSAVIEEIGIRGLVEQAGFKRVVDEFGLKRVIDEYGSQRVIEELGGVGGILEKMSPAQREELKRRLHTKER